MTDLRQAAEQALKAFEVATTHFARDRQEILAAMQALRQALGETAFTDQGVQFICLDCPQGGCCDVEEPPNSTTDVVEPEPFGWLYKQVDGNLYKLLRGEDAEWSDKNNPHWVKVSPLYIAPPKREWVGLTDEEIERDHYFPFYYRKFARAIEAKLREKNT